MFGPDDAFLATIIKLLRQLPVYPMFGPGLTRLQPAYVGIICWRGYLDLVRTSFCRGSH